MTPPLKDIILPGVTRDSVLSIARSHESGSTKVAGFPDKVVVSERKICMPEVVAAAEKGKLKEVFGSGTAAIVSAVEMIGSVSISFLQLDAGADDYASMRQVRGQAGQGTDRRWRVGTDCAGGTSGDRWSADWGHRERLERVGQLEVDARQLCCDGLYLALLAVPSHTVSPSCWHRTDL